MIDRLKPYIAVLFVLALASTGWAEERPESRAKLSPEEVEAAILEEFPSIQAAAAAVEGARARLAQVRRLPDPTLEIGGGRGEDRRGPESGSQWEAGLELELPTPWRYGRARTAAEAGISVASADLVGVRARTIAEIRTLLLELAAAQRRVEVLQSQVELVTGLADLAALRVRLGEARELERLRMQVELGRIQRRADLARAERDALNHTLVRLSGDRLPPDFTVRFPLHRTPPPLNGADLRAAVLRSNPELAAQTERARAAKARAAFQRSMALPSVVTRAGYAREYDSRSTSIAVALKLPLWNRNAPGVAEAEAERRAAEARAERTRRDVLARLGSAVSRYQAARATALRFAETILPAAREATRLAELSYREGETSLLDLLDARRAAQDSELESVQARLQLHLLKVEIDLLTGRLGTGTSPTSPDDHKENAS